MNAEPLTDEELAEMRALAGPYDNGNRYWLNRDAVEGLFARIDADRKRLALLEEVAGLARETKERLDEMATSQILSLEWRVIWRRLTLRLAALGDKDASNE